MVIKADVNLFCWRQGSLSSTAASKCGCSCHDWNRKTCADSLITLFIWFSTHTFISNVLCVTGSKNAAKLLRRYLSQVDPRDPWRFQQTPLGFCGILYLTDFSYLLSDDRCYIFILIKKLQEQNEILCIKHCLVNPENSLPLWPNSSSFSFKHSCPSSKPPQLSSRKLWMASHHTEKGDKLFPLFLPVQQPWSRRPGRPCRLYQGQADAARLTVVPTGLSLPTSSCQMAKGCSELKATAGYFTGLCIVVWLSCRRHSSGSEQRPPALLFPSLLICRTEF